MSLEQTCSFCNNEVNNDFEFCPYCGTIFIEEVYCTNHSSNEAAGVCLICESAFCSECGSFISEKFFCNEHSEYEVFQGMARVYGDGEQIRIDYIKSLLEEEGLHPLVYGNMIKTINPAFYDESLFKVPGDYYKRNLSEIKILVPLSEVLRAEEVIGNIEQ